MFGKDKEQIAGREWDWEAFETTEGFPLSENLLDWVIGQEKAMEECKLCLDEWIHKLKYLKKKKWWRFWESPDSEKPSIKEFLPAGPFLLLLGDAGTGKSLMGRALANVLTDLYKLHEIDLVDIVAWANNLIPSNPKISIHKAGEGKKKVRIEKIKTAKKARMRNWLIKGVMGFIATIGSIFMAAGLSSLIQAIMVWQRNGMTIYGMPIQELWGGSFLSYMMNTFVSVGSTTFLPAGMMFLFLILVLFLGRFGMTGGQKGIAGAEQTEAPKLIVDNSECVAPFIDATGHGSSQLFGSIAWDPLQTGGLGTPEHQRCASGDVHRAHLGILYIDEIKNLKPLEAITLLTVLEDGQLPIALRSMGFGGGETAAMSVSTEPVPCMNFLVAAGNFDSIQLIHPALMDRIRGYGKVVRMNNEMPNTIANRRKYVQFIAQEIKRFNLLPFSKEACEEVISEGRRQSNFRDKLTTRFRPMISVIKTSAVLAMNENKKVVERKHVKEAIQEHCKSIHKQLLEYSIDYTSSLKHINPDNEPCIGQIAGLVVSKFGEDMVGDVRLIKASLKKIDEKDKGYFKVCGIQKEAQATWIHDSAAKVFHVINMKYGVNLSKEYATLVDFQQASLVDGPSAGITMALALISALKKKKIRQDVAVTGEITIDQKSNKILITPIGGVDAKIRAAQGWGYKKVVIPKKNLEHSINPKDYDIEIVGAETLEDYMKEVFE